MTVFTQIPRTFSNSLSNAANSISKRLLELGSIEFMKLTRADEAMGLSEVVEPWLAAVLPALLEIAPHLSSVSAPDSASNAAMGPSIVALSGSAANLTGTVCVPVDAAANSLVPAEVAASASSDVPQSTVSSADVTAAASTAEDHPSAVAEMTTTLEHALCTTESCVDVSSTNMPQFFDEVAAVSAASSSTVMSEQPPRVLILYGSQTGASKSIAERVYANAVAMRIQCDLACLNDYAGARFASVRFLIVVCSTTGDGDAPNNADE
jgi:hypothetical protein